MNYNFKYLSSEFVADKNAVLDFYHSNHVTSNVLVIDRLLLLHPKGKC